MYRPGQFWMSVYKQWLQLEVMKLNMDIGFGHWDAWNFQQGHMPVNCPNCLLAAQSITAQETRSKYNKLALLNGPAGPVFGRKYPCMNLSFDWHVSHEDTCCPICTSKLGHHTYNLAISFIKVIPGWVSCSSLSTTDCTQAPHWTYPCSVLSYSFLVLNCAHEGSVWPTTYYIIVHLRKNGIGTHSEDTLTVFIFGSILHW